MEAGIGHRGAPRHRLWEPRKRPAVPQEFNKRNYMRTSAYVCALLLLCSLGGWPALPQTVNRQGPAPILLTTAPQLFVDDRLVERLDNVVRTLHNPDRAAENPVLKPDQDWEGSLVLQPGTVLYDQEEHIFKMWYNSLPTASKPDIEEFICYATSLDGIHWTRPELNLVEFRGSKKNNILLKGCSWSLSVIKDSRERDPSRRYKLAYWNWLDAGKEGVWIAFSADGIRWSVRPNPVVPMTASSDTFCVMQDPATGQFWMYHKPSIFPVRKVSRLVSDDFVNWRNDELILEPDDHDQPDTEFYGMSPFPYGDQYLGLLWVLHTYAQQIDIQLVSSRDGRHWDRSGRRRVFMPLGFVKLDYAGKAFDSEMIMSIAPPVVEGGRLWFFYSGFDVKHNAAMGKFVDTYADGVGQIGAASMPEYEISSLNATSEGSVVTRPLRLQGKAMSVTVATYTFRGKDGKVDPAWTGLFTKVKDGDGEVRVEVLDEFERPISGYTAGECVPLSGATASRTVSWAQHPDLRNLRGRLVRFKFVLRNASLLAFRVV